MTYRKVKSFDLIDLHRMLLFAACVRKVGGAVQRQIATPRPCVLANWFIVMTSATVTPLANVLMTAIPTHLYAPAVAAQTDSSSILW